MRVSMQEICRFADTHPKAKSFIGGEELLNAGFVLQCGKLSNDSDSVNSVKILGFCIQTSHMKQSPHEVKGEISKDGRITKMECSCKAGLSGACKHVVAILLYCNRNDLESLNSITCTDKKCVWSAPHASSLEKYEAKPLNEHQCIKEKSEALSGTRMKKLTVGFKQNEEGNVELSEAQEESFREIMRSLHPDSALAQHICGRHAIFKAPSSNQLSLSPIQMQAIFGNQELSHVLHNLRKLEAEPLQECCQSFMSQLNKNVLVICHETMKYYSCWLKERQLRITGSVANGIFTYRNNKTPNWEKKPLNYFYPKSQSNCYVKHGLDNEKLARTAYAQSIMPLEVVETGLIVSQDNPWLGFSPDGVIFDGSVPLKLIKIKCPYNGKTKRLAEVLVSLNWLSRKGDRLYLKEAHTYFAQVQIGMAVLNLSETVFIIYAPFDNQFISFSAKFNSAYTTKLLHTMKSLYHNKMIHYACQKENNYVEEERKM